MTTLCLCDFNEREFEMLGRISAVGAATSALRVDRSMADQPTIGGEPSRVATAGREDHPLRSLHSMIAWPNAV